MLQLTIGYKTYDIEGGQNLCFLGGGGPKTFYFFSGGKTYEESMKKQEIANIPSIFLPRIKKRSTPNLLFYLYPI